MLLVAGSANYVVAAHSQQRQVKQLNKVDAELPPIEEMDALDWIRLEQVCVWVACMWVFGKSCKWQREGGGVGV